MQAISVFRVIKCMSWKIKLFFVLILCPGLGFSEPADYPISILIPTTYPYYPDVEQSMNIKGDWFSLLRLGDKKWTLKSTKVGNKISMGGVAGGHQQTVTSDYANTKYLLQHVSLKEGVLSDTPISYKDYASYVPIRENVCFNYSDIQYCMTENNGVAYIETKDTRIFLGEIEDPDEDRYSELSWAGDLNHDELLDIIVQYNFYDGYSACLYITTKIGSSEVLEKISCFHVGT